LSWSSRASGSACPSKRRQRCRLLSPSCRCDLRKPEQQLALHQQIDQLSSSSRGCLCSCTSTAAAGCDPAGDCCLQRESAGCPRLLINLTSTAVPCRAVSCYRWSRQHPWQPPQLLPQQQHPRQQQQQQPRPLPLRQQHHPRWRVWRLPAPCLAPCTGARVCCHVGCCCCSHFDEQNRTVCAYLAVCQGAATSWSQQPKEACFAGAHNNTAVLSNPCHPLSLCLPLPYQNPSGALPLGSLHL
jgi:hypothetical protein